MHWAALALHTKEGGRAGGGCSYGNLQVKRNHSYSCEAQMYLEVENAIPPPLHPSPHSPLCPLLSIKHSLYGDKPYSRLDYYIPVTRIDQYLCILKVHVIYFNHYRHKNIIFSVLCDFSSHMILPHTVIQCSSTHRNGLY